MADDMMNLRVQASASIGLLRSVEVNDTYRI